MKKIYTISLALLLSASFAIAQAPAGDMCMDAVDINDQFGQTPGETQSSGPYDNTDATTDASDPDFGWECFGEPDGTGSAPSLERTLWFTFEGDGNNYFIEALPCGSDAIDFGDTQFAIYSGGCDNLEAVRCNDDGPSAMPGGPFPAGDTLQTEAGVTYYLMVDGFGPNFPADGEFCIEVTDLAGVVAPTGDMCMDAVDINDQFGQALGETQTSGPYDNTDATTDASDPDFGWECFGEPDGSGSAPSLERTLWFTFEGDGSNYFIEALACGGDPIDFSDTQFAVYTGGCDNLEAVLCSEDGPNTDGDSGFFPAGDTLQTEAGVTYYLMVDGFGPDFPADGEFCIEVTKLESAETVAVTFQVDASRLVEEGTLSPDGIFLAGEFNGWPDPGAPMTEGADNVWSVIFDLAPGTYEYKFQNGPGGWENIDTSIGDDCTVGDTGNRQVVVENMDLTTDLVCFNYCVSCGMVVNVDEKALQAGIEVFPNPVRDILNVKVDLPETANALNIRLVNTLGQVVMAHSYGQLQSDNIELDMSQLPAGTYLLQVRDGQAQYAQSVIVQR